MNLSRLFCKTILDIALARFEIGCVVLANFMQKFANYHIHSHISQVFYLRLNKSSDFMSEYFTVLSSMF